jgi:protein arginine kinase activator
MKRKCDHCNEEATVHEVVIKNGAKVEKHLCEIHAKDEGIAVHGHAPIGDLITKFVMSQAGQETSSARQEEVCPDCGMTWPEFRQHGLLGCGHCYACFEEQLSRMIERVHEGGTHHVGKAPQGSEGLLEREHKISSLRKQLTEAVAAEQYERAATLRDELLSAERREEATEPNGAELE